MTDTLVRLGIVAHVGYKLCLVNVSVRCPRDQNLRLITWSYELSQRTNQPRLVNCYMIDDTSVPGRRRYASHPMNTYDIVGANALFAVWRPSHGLWRAANRPAAWCQGGRIADQSSRTVAALSPGKVNPANGRGAFCPFSRSLVPPHMAFLTS